MTREADGAETGFTRCRSGVAERQVGAGQVVSSRRGDRSGEHEGHEIRLEVLDIVQAGIIHGRTGSILRGLDDRAAEGYGAREGHISKTSQQEQDRDRKKTAHPLHHRACRVRTTVSVWLWFI